MNLFDRIRRAARADAGQPAEPDDSGMSRRDFFARFAGREMESEPGEQTSPSPDAGVLHTFLVKGFPYHSGPVLVPILRQGEEYKLTPDPPYSANPTAVRIERGRDHLGYVPDEHVAEILGLLKEGAQLVCRASRVDPAAELARILTVEIVRPPEPESEHQSVPEVR